MTEPQPHDVFRVGPGVPPPPPPPPPARRKGLSTPAIVGITVLAIIVLCVGALAVVLAIGGLDLQKNDPGSGKPLSTTAPAPPAAKQTFYQPKSEDFTLAVKILDQKCFGSAGCNVEFRVELTYQGAGVLDPSVTYEVTYEVRGGEDVHISTLEVTGDRYKADGHELIQTKSSKAVLTAVVTSVSKA